MSQYTALQLPLIHAGKVRELYALERDDAMLMVATDNISAYDFVLSPGIDGKGVVLTQLSLWWFEQLADVVDSHVISADPADELGPQRAKLVAGRALVCDWN